MSPGGAEKFKILFLIDDELRIKSILLFLSNQGHEVRVAKTYPDALDLMEDFSPDVVLLTWHLKYADVKTVYSAISENLKIPCVVFAEEASAKTAVGLMNSGIENHMLAPVS